MSVFGNSTLKCPNMQWFGESNETFESHFCCSNLGFLLAVMKHLGAGAGGVPLENLVILSSKLSWSSKPVLWKPVGAAASYWTWEKFIWKCFSYTPIILAYTWSAAKHLILSFFFFPLSCHLSISFYFSTAHHLPTFLLSPILFLSPFFSL